MASKVVVLDVNDLQTPDDVQTAIDTAVAAEVGFDVVAAQLTSVRSHKVALLTFNTASDPPA